MTIAFSESGTNQKRHFDPLACYIGVMGIESTRKIRAFDHYCSATFKFCGYKQATHSPETRFLSSKKMKIMPALHSYYEK